MMYTLAQRRANSTAAAHCLLSFLMAPLLTISTSLQISQLHKRVTIADINPSIEVASKKFNIQTSRLQDRSAQ